MSTLENIRLKLASWAESEKLVAKCYLFGGCAKGHYPDVSDIDVAIELQDCGNDDETFNAWSGTSPEFRQRIEALELPRIVDLQWYGGAIATPKIHQYLQEKSELLYESAN